MSMMNAIIGNASEVDVASLDAAITSFLIEGEKIERAWKLIRDYFVFTNMRLLLVDVQGITGSKVDYHSIPYKSISHFRVETAGRLDLDSELHLYVRDLHDPIVKQFKKNSNIADCQRELAKHILLS